MKAEKATDSPNTFKSVAILKRRNTLKRFLKIVFIRDLYYLLYYSFLMLRTGFSLAIFQDFRITHPQMIARTSRAVDMKIKTVSGILSANCLNQLSPTTREAITPKRIAGKAVTKTSLDKRRKISPCSYGASRP